MSLAYARAGGRRTSASLISTRDGTPAGLAIPVPTLVTCDITSWTDHEITFGGYTGDYGQGIWVVTEGDDIEVQVWNPQSGKGPLSVTSSPGSGVPAQCSGR
jgi:hypothetical protein